MTRKEALREAIHIVSNARIGKRRKKEILSGLTLCLRELPFAHWTKEAVFDACDTWIQEHGALQLRAFASPLMPSHPTIKNRFGMTAREFRDRYYPMDRAAGSPYGAHGVDEWNRAFQEEFQNMRCTGQADYNRRRDRALPTWNTVAAMNGVKTWRALLGKLGLSAFQKPEPCVRMQIRIQDQDS